jgi:hypothetical protein
MAIGRRTLIVGASLAGLVAAAGVVAFRNANRGGGRDPESLAYARYLDAVASDYREGRLVVVGGWVLSNTEANAHQAPPVGWEDRNRAVTTSSARDAT